MNRVTLDWRDVDEPSWIPSVTRFSARALDAMEKDNWELSLLFCSDDFIRTLNRHYRGKDEATDVLSFSMGETIEENDSPIFIAGDIVISIPALFRNAQEFGVGADEELKRLIVHGILHLSGMDHEDNNPLQPMLVEQESILLKLSGEKIL